MKNKKGFTLAEIIISMTIIGVIAAITIPALLVSTNDKAMQAQKKALIARMSQAISQIEDLRIYEKSELEVDKSSALNFITKGLSKVYRIKKTCDKKSISKNCGFPEEFATQDGTPFNISSNQKITDLLKITAGSSTVYSGLNTEVAGFVTANGESVVVYYNPRCRGSRSNGFYEGSTTSAMCLNMIYDLNGKDEAPNEVGKDIGFLTVFFPKDPDVVGPITYSKDATITESLPDKKYEAVISACKTQNKELIVPTWTDGMSMSINKKLINTSDDVYIVSGAGKINGAYQVNMETFESGTQDSWASTYKLRCIYNK